MVYTSVLGVLGPTEEASFPPNLYPFLSLLKTSLDGSKISCTSLQGTDWRIFVMWLHPIPKRKTMGAGPASFEVPLEEEPDFSPLTFSDHWCCSNVMFSGWFHRAPDCLLTLRRRSHIWWNTERRPVLLLEKQIQMRLTEALKSQIPIKGLNWPLSLTGTDSNFPDGHFRSRVCLLPFAPDLNTLVLISLTKEARHDT